MPFAIGIEATINLSCALLLRLNQELGVILPETKLSSWIAALLILPSTLSHGDITDSGLEEVVVSATLQTGDAQHTSITAFLPETLAQRSAQHLEDLLSAAPNVNSSSGASRSRFFQIRGIGERSQFVEPVNASIAMLLDGIDLTGLGGAATTWDLKQVEILRGPQGTLLGANALAGLINLQSTLADQDTGARLSAGIESDNGRRLGLAAGNSLSANWSGRVAMQQYRSDGYQRNHWLERDDTNRRDEFTGRVSLVWLGDNDRIDIGLHHIDIDNGYDAFSLDNTRQTLSDEPGQDTTQTQALRARWQRQGQVNWMAQLSAATTDMTYSYDEDWSYQGIAPGWEYSSFDRYDRQRDMASIELRADSSLGSLDWVSGVYLRREEESLRRQYTYLDAPFSSDLDINTAAIFGQLSSTLTETVSTYVGARLERRATSYRDSNTVAAEPSNTLWSGRAGVEWQISDNNLIYAGLSRGVRGGGVNASLLASLKALQPSQTISLRPLGLFNEEALLSTELGWRWRNAENTLRSDVTIFRMRRQDQQVGRSLVLPRPDGSTAFIDYTDNAARSSSQGLEWQFSWLASDRFTLTGSMGLLDAQFDRYVTALGDDLSDRDQPQAPNAMGQLALNWQLAAEVSAGLEWTHMESYFFSDRHDTRSPSRDLVNGHIRWQSGPWSIQLWGRNLADKDYFVRGFGSFGNDPRKQYVVEPYYQFGEPRVVGLTVEFGS